MTSTDFTDNPLADLGVSVTYTPVTVVVHNETGQREMTDGTPTAITAIFENANQKYDLDKAGLNEGADARIFVSSAQSISRDDKIAYQSRTYRVDSVSTRRLGLDDLYKTVLLFLIT